MNTGTFFYSNEICDERRVIRNSHGKHYHYVARVRIGRFTFDADGCFKPPIQLSFFVTGHNWKQKNNLGFSMMRIDARRIDSLRRYNESCIRFRLKDVIKN